MFAVHKQLDSLHSTAHIWLWLANWPQSWSSRLPVA